jgi:hypothetical protein
VLFPRTRWLVCAFAVLALLAGASSTLSPLLSTALWLPALVVLAGDPSSPVRRAVGRGLHLSIDDPASAGGGESSRPDASVGHGNGA